MNHKSLFTGNGSAKCTPFAPMWRKSAHALTSQGRPEVSTRVCAFCSSRGWASWSGSCRPCGLVRWLPTPCYSTGWNAVHYQMNVLLEVNGLHQAIIIISLVMALSHSGINIQNPGSWEKGIFFSPLTFLNIQLLFSTVVTHLAILM